MEEQEIKRVEQLINESPVHNLRIPLEEGIITIRGRPKQWHGTWFASFEYRFESKEIEIEGRPYVKTTLCDTGEYVRVDHLVQAVSSYKWWKNNWRRE